MTTEVIVAIVTGIFTLAGVIATVISGNRKTQAQIKATSELTQYRIAELEKKQDKHNGLIERMYQVEKDVKLLDEKQKEADRRIDDLEKHKEVTKK